jgi:hypothetical protein
MNRQVGSRTGRCRSRARVLSVIAHGRGDVRTAVQVTFAALVASRGLDAERAVLYSDWIRIALGKAARAAWSS